MLGAVTLLFINRVYPPDPGATGRILAELAERLAPGGRVVAVLASRTGADQASEEVRNGVRVYRVAGLPFSRRSHLHRALAYLSLYPALLSRARRLGPMDAVVTMTDPPLLAALGPMMKRRLGGRLVHWAQDVYPELAEALGVLRPGGLAARTLRGISNRALRRHDRIIAIGRCMADRLARRGALADPARLAVIPNWSDADAVRPVPPEDNAFRAEHELAGRFVVMYSGNLGLAHPFQAIVEAAARLPQALFLFVGDGPRRAEVEAMAAQRGLENVRFLPFQPAARLSESLSAADLHLACMEPGLAGLLVPSKLYGILAAGRPCIFLGPAASEAALRLAETGAGEVMEAADGGALAERIAAWQADPARREAAGRAGRAAAEAQGLAQATAAFAALLDEGRQ